MLQLTIILSTLTYLLGCDPQNCINLKCHYEKAKPHCTYGCKPGYAGNICKEYCDHICFSCERYNIRRCTVCYNGYYGSRCEHQCTNCDNLRCYTNGSCCELSQLAGTCDTTCPTGCPDYSEETTSTYTPSTTIDSSGDSETTSTYTPSTTIDSSGDSETTSTYTPSTTIDSSGDSETTNTYTPSTTIDSSGDSETTSTYTPSTTIDSSGDSETTSTYTPSTTIDSSGDSETTSTYTPCATIDSSGDPDTKEDVHCKTNCIDDDETECTGGCQPGYHDTLCDERCSEHCVGACSQDTGHCLTGCKPNWFSSTCSQPCSKNCVNDVCDRESGECIHGCKDGFYGLNCSKACSGNCTEGKCDVNGGCRCERGTRDESCYINCEDCVGEECGIDEDGQVTCPRGCKDLQTGSFCKELAPCNVRPECQSLSVGRRKKRDTENCNEEDEHGQCVCCKEGWRGLNCDIPCPPCRYSYREGCSLACAGGFFGQECHFDCPANCSRATNGKSRCDENGVCDSGCLLGHYGYVCEHTCSSTCLARICFMNNGSCTEGCVSGRWGPRCDNQCGHCVDMKCERDGSCTCEDEYYGPRCEYKCSDHCLSNLCFVDIDGNHFCEGECQPSYTGLDCLSPCPPRCSTCDKESGICGDVSEETTSTYTSSTTVGSSVDPESQDPQLILGISVGVSVAVVVIAVLVLLAGLWRKRKKMKGYKNQEDEDNDQSSNGDTPLDAYNKNMSNPPNSNQSVDGEQGESKF